MYDSLRDECELLKLRAGDMIVDIASNNVGILVERDRRISIQDDDVYFWKIHWAKESIGNVHTPSYTPMTIQMEEEGLKISIVIGLYDLFEANQ